MTTTATITEITAQRKEARLTTGTASYTITLNATPTAGDLLIICTTTNGVVVTQNAPTYGGTTATVASTGALNGSLQIKTWYIVTNSTNIAAGGTSVGVTNSSGPTTAGYAVTVIRNADNTNPIGVTSNATGSVTNNGYVYPFQASGGNNTISTAQGSACLFFATLNGAYTGYAMVMTTPTTSIPLASGWGPATGAASDVQAYTVALVSDPATETTINGTGGPEFIQLVAASRNYSATWVAINPGTYAPLGTSIDETAADTNSFLNTTDSQRGGSIDEQVADVSNQLVSLDALTGAPINVTTTTTSLQTTIGPRGVIGGNINGKAAASGQATGSVSASAAPVVMFANVANLNVIFATIPRIPGRVVGKIKTGSVVGSTLVGSAVGRVKSPSVVGDWEVKP